MAIGAILWFQRDIDAGLWLLLIGFVGVLYTMYAWWSDVIKEGQAAITRPVVQMHHRYGMMLFIASEVMFFVAWFWAYFDWLLPPRRPSSSMPASPPWAAPGRRPASSCSTPGTCRCSTR